MNSPIDPDTGSDGAAPPLSGGSSDLARLVRLAIPLIAAHSGQQLMSFVDAAMVGRLDAAAIGGVGIGNSVFFGVSVMGMGTILGMDPVVAQAAGAGEHGRARRTLWQGARIALAMSVPLMILVVLLSLALDPLGIEPSTAGETRRFLWARLPNIPPFLLFVAARSYLQSEGGARAIVVSTVLANVANALFNFLLIYGDGGLTSIGLPGIGIPALGVVGSGLSSSIASVVSLIVCVRGIERITPPPDPERRRSDPEIRAKILKLGIPLALQILAEVGAFTIASILAGRMGKGPAAGYQVAITLASLTFTVTLGLGAATSVLVGQAIGRKDTPAARRVGFLSLKAALVFMSLGAAAFLLFPGPLARILTDSPEVLAAAIPLVQIAGFFQLSDGAQVVAAGALRGAGDTKYSQRANVVGHYLVGLPVAIGLGFGLGMGGPGLWWGLSAGLTTVAVMLTLRFHSISKARMERV
ncbi:MAG: MATE family efflux transporter [Polyangiaceae bacterium]